MKLLWSYLRRHFRLLVLALILATIGQIFSLLDPQIFRYIIDHLASRVGQLNYHDYLNGVYLVIGATIGAAFMSRVTKAFQDYLVNVIVQRVGAQMYQDSVAHALSLPFAVFEDQRSGELLSKLQKARDDTQRLINQSITTFFLPVVSTILVLAYAFYVNGYVGLTYFLILPILGVATFLLSRRIKAVQRTIVAQTVALAGSTTETLRNVELVKSLGLETQESSRLNTANAQILELELLKIRKVRTFSFIQGTLINGLRSLLMLIMLLVLYKGGMTLGEFFSLVFYSFFLFTPLSDLGTLATTYQEARASLEKLHQVFEVPKEVEPVSPRALSALGSVVFQNVSFAYGDGRLALSEVSLSIQPGRTVAFVGPSGAGKSTIIKLLLGLYKPTAGEIRFNDIPTNELDMRSMRNRVGLVLQETQLFAGTIHENLLFVRPSATDEECVQALRDAAVENIITRDKAGLEARIGEGGIKLSGGERQRIAIARALLRRPEMLVFDEATSALDSITEEEITQTIRELRKRHPELTTVMIAHRLSTVMHADTIYVLERGRVAEYGSHDELLKKGELYAALWRQQAAG